MFDPDGTLSSALERLRERDKRGTCNLCLGAFMLIIVPSLLLFAVIGAGKVFFDPDSIGNQISDDVIRNKVDTRYLVHQVTSSRDLHGPQGEKGDQGLMGPPGPMGMKGDKGDNCVLANEPIDALRERLQGTVQVYLDRKNGGTPGGSSQENAWAVRTINTVGTGTLHGTVTTLESSAITLSSGFMYDIDVEAPCHECGHHVIRLWNVSTNRLLVSGSTEVSGPGTTTRSRARLMSLTVDNGPLTFRIEHRSAYATARGFGNPHAFPGMLEEYSRVFIRAYKL